MQWSNWNEWGGCVFLRQHYLNTISVGAGRGDRTTLFISTEDRLKLYSCPLSVLMARVSSAGLMHMVSISWHSAGVSSLLYGSGGIWQTRINIWSLWNILRVCCPNVTCINIYPYHPASSITVLLILFKKTDHAGPQRACKALGVGQNGRDARHIGTFIHISVFDLLRLHLPVQWINEIYNRVIHKTNRSVKDAPKPCW